jgi:hypothetical protein
LRIFFIGRQTSCGMLVKDRRCSNEEKNSDGMRQFLKQRRELFPRMMQDSEVIALREPY